MMVHNELANVNIKHIILETPFAVNHKCQSLEN